MTRMLCAALLTLSGLAAVARAADPSTMPAPTESAPPGAMPAPAESAPPGNASGRGPVVSAGELAEDAPLARPADLSYGVAARLRWVTVPSWMLNLFTKKNVPLSSWGTGIEVYRRKANFDLVGSISYQSMSPPDGNWLGKGHDADLDTDYVQFRGLGLYGIDVSFVWHTMFNEWFGMHYGAGIGLGIVSGNILRTSNGRARDAAGNPMPGDGACTEANAGDVTQCHPVAIDCSSGKCNELQLIGTMGPPDGSGNPHRFVESNVPPVLPIVNIVIGVDFKLPQVRGWEARIEGGFYDAFFLGGAVGYTF